MVIDPVAIDEQEARDRAALARYVDEPGGAGMLARLTLETVGIDRWAAQEVARGASYAEILSAVMLRAASMVGTQLVNAAVTTNERAVLCARLAQLAGRFADRVEAGPPTRAPADPDNPLQ